LDGGSGSNGWSGSGKGIIVAIRGSDSARTAAVKSDMAIVERIVYYSNYEND